MALRLVDTGTRSMVLERSARTLNVLKSKYLIIFRVAFYDSF